MKRKPLYVFICILSFFAFLSCVNTSKNSYRLALTKKVYVRVIQGQAHLYLNSQMTENVYLSSDFDDFGVGKNQMFEKGTVTSNDNLLLYEGDLKMFHLNVSEVLFLQVEQVGDDPLIFEFYVRGKKTLHTLQPDSLIGLSFYVTN